MTVAQLVEKLNLKVLCGSQGLHKTITGGYVSDLLSDVMGNANEGCVWVTLQTHKNVIAIASLKDLSAVIMVNGLQPDADTIVHSESESIPILGTTEKTFEITGKLYNFINGDSLNGNISK
jgi:serine kinase of HPr protein (carbohydrate metabolism regulator)